MLVRYFVCEGCSRIIPVPVEEERTAEPPELCPHCECSEIRPTNLYQNVAEDGDITLTGFWCNECEHPFYVEAEVADEALCPICGSDDFAPID